MATTPPAAYTCPWCSTPSLGGASSCPGCGAPIDVTIKQATSGWVELPPIKDMAHIQIGQSSVQVAGTIVPSADFSLAAGDSLYFPHHELLWKDPTVVLQQMNMRGGWQRMMAGLPVHMVTATGPGHIAFSRDAAGETIAIPIPAGSAVDVREHVFMVATSAVGFDWFPSNVWFQTRSGDDAETHYPMGQFMDRFHATSQHGLLIIHGHGNAFLRYLQPGERILVKPTAVLYKDTTVRMQLHFEHPSGTWRSWGSWGNRYLWLSMWGPGRVAIQSQYAHVHDPGYDLVGSSNATSHRW